MGPEWIWVALVAVGGFLLGGVYSAWKTSKVVAGALFVLVLLAAAGAVAWYMSV
jgi:membrane protein DedA with SNARE-associated domain